MWRERTQFVIRRHAATIAILLLGCCLMALPSGVTLAIRSAYQRATAPAKQVTRLAIRTCGRVCQSLASIGSGPQPIEHFESEIGRLRATVAALTAERDALRAERTPGAVATDERSGLIQADLVPARLLGHQATAVLRQRQIIDQGTARGIDAPSLLVQPANAVLDQGGDSALAEGQLVASGACVWGKILKAGPWTSTVCRAQDVGFRDVVAFLPPAGRVGGPVMPQGVLYGTGHELCEVRFVAVTEPVEIGDLVVSTTGHDLGLSYLRYGTVVKVDAPADAHYWNISVKPEVDYHAWTDQVFVVRARLNPDRVASRDTSATRQ